MTDNEHVTNDDFLEEVPQQRFTGYWIPVEISKLGLSWTEQLLLSMIDSLEADAPKYCFASNKYLAEKMDLSESRVSFYITKLKRMGLIEEVGFSGRRRTLRTIKSNWFTRPDSKKELCVNPSRQSNFQKKNYAWNRVGRLRDSANHIVKIDKTDTVIVCAPVAPGKNEESDKGKVEAQEEALSDHKKVVKQGFGKTHELCKNDVIVHAIQKRKTWSAEEIDEAWSVLVAYSDPIRDVFAFIDGTIKNNKKLKGLKSFEEKIENSYGTKSNGYTSSQKSKSKEAYPDTEKNQSREDKDEKERLIIEQSKRNDEIREKKRQAEAKEEEDKRMRIKKRTQEIQEMILTADQEEKVMKLVKKKYIELSYEQKKRICEFLGI